MTDSVMLPSAILDVKQPCPSRFLSPRARNKLIQFIAYP